MGGLVNAIQVGIDGDVVAVSDLDAASAAFQTAVDKLPTGGGDLYVFPTDVAGGRYRFDATVVVQTARVRIRFAPGATLDLATTSPPQGLFDVRAADFHCIGAQVRHTLTAASAGGTFFLVRDSAFVGQSNEARFEDCTFDLDQSAADDAVLSGLSCIRVVGLATPNRHGLHVTGCSFVLRPGARQGFPWTGSGEPTGVCGIRTETSGQGLIVANSFRSSDATAPGDCGPMLYLNDSHETVIAANVFARLRLPATDPAQDVDRSAVVRLSRFSGPGMPEGHHTILSGNLFEDIRSDCVVWLEDAFYDGFVGNDVGDVRDSAQAAVLATGSQLAFVGNGFHAVQPSQGVPAAAVLAIYEGTDIQLAGNTMTELDPQAPPVLASSLVRNLHSSPAQARGLEGG